MSEGPGKQTVLVVDRDPTIVTLFTTALQMQGYHVLASSCGQHALELAKEYRAVDLILVDVGLNDIPSKQLAQLLREFIPLLKVVFVSGRLKLAQIDSGILPADAEFLVKPATMHALIAKVNKVLAT